MIFVQPCLRMTGALGIAGVPRGVSGFAEAWDLSVSSLLRSSLLLLPMSSMKWKPGSAPSRTRLHWWLSAGPPSVRLSWRLAGAGGPKPSGTLWLGLPPSPARLAALPPTPPWTLASGLHSVSAAPFTRAILRRSPGSVNGSSGLAGDQVPSSGW